MRKNLIFLLLLGLVITSFSEIAVAQQEPMATIRLINGTLEFKRSESEEWEIATLGMMLFPGNQLRTGRNSKAYILFTDATQVKMNESSLLTIEGKREKRSLVKKLELKVGQIWAKVTRQDSPMEIETPTSVASIKGTEFYFLVEQNGNSTLVVLEGSIEFMNELGQMLVGEMTQAISDGTNPPNIQPIDPDDVPNWQNTIDPSWNLHIDPEGSFTKPLNTEFNLNIKAVKVSTGEIDPDYDKLVKISTNSSTMEFSIDEGQNWSSAEDLSEFNLINGQRTILAKDLELGMRLIGVSAEESSPAFAGVTISQDAGEEQKTMVIEITDENGELKKLILTYTSQN